MMPISEVTNECNMQMMARYTDKFFDLAVVDPPYGISMSSNPIRKKHKKKNWDNSIPNESYFEELFRVSKDQIIWGGNYFNLPPSQGFIIWDKKQPADFSLAMCEFAWLSIQSPAKIYNKSVLGEQNKMHPTQKPIKLYTWCMQRYAKPGDKILDTHLGSGSSRIAAYDLGFDFYGCELDEDYYKAQEARFATHLSKPKLFTPQQLSIEQPGLFTNG